MFRYKAALVLASVAVLLTGCTNASDSASKDPVFINVKADGPTSCNSDGGEVLIKVTPYRTDAFSRFNIVVSVFESGDVAQRVSVKPEKGGGVTLPFACKGKEADHYRVVVTGSGDHGLKGRGTDAFDVYSVPKSLR